MMERSRDCLARPPAMPGRAAATHRIDAIGDTPLSGAFSGGIEATSMTDDFLITGPAGPATIAGTLNLRLQAVLSLVGGFPGNGGHQGHVGVSVSAAQATYPFSGIAQTFGDLNVTNGGPFSSGCLAGLTSPDVDVPLSLAGSFPVGVPFSPTARSRPDGASSAGTGAPGTGRALPRGSTSCAGPAMVRASG